MTKTTKMVIIKNPNKSNEYFIISEADIIQSHHKNIDPKANISHCRRPKYLLKHL